MQNIIKLPDATMIFGDNVTEMKNIADESIDLSVFSPPFPELYCYSDDIRDMGNCKTYDEFKQHFSFLLPDLFRVIKEGRNVCIHCMDVPVQKGKHGYIGLRDFSGMIIEMMQEVGFIYHSRITIWKNPVTEMQRTKALGLLHKQVKKDSTMSRVGIPDYVLVFRKDGERLSPVKCGITVDQWQQYASPVWQFNDWTMDAEMILPLLDKDEYLAMPAALRNKFNAPVWMDIDYGNTLNAAVAREDKDEKHICPLQIDTIERLVTLYSNPGDTVLSPFGGIGSEGYQSIKMGRKAVLIELKKSYFNILTKNIKAVIESKAQSTLFNFDESKKSA